MFPTDVKSKLFIMSAELFGFMLAVLLVAFLFMYIWNYGVVVAVTFAQPIGYIASFCLTIPFLSISNKLSS
jgi:hypothetical protein